MAIDLVWLGLLAGALTSTSFLPQIAKGLKTKSLEDLSYWMPAVLGTGMGLWLLYGVLVEDWAIIVANIVGVSCNMTLIGLKRHYS